MSDLSLLHARPRLAFITIDWMQPNLVWIIWCVDCVTLAPVITDSVGKDVSGLIECRG